MSEQLTITINDTVIIAKQHWEDTKGEAHILGVVFDVTHEQYHDIAVLLYKNDFHIQFPSKELSFQATIHSYSTSITNLYHEGEVGEFKVEFIEKI